MSAPLAALRSPGHPTFPVWHCERCAREVLAYLDVGENDVEMRRCLSCDGPVAELALRKVARREVEQLGYVVLDERRKASHVKGGCGVGGIRSCGSGGCSSGGCSTGGCSSGGCGK